MRLQLNILQLFPKFNLFFLFFFYLYIYIYYFFIFFRLHANSSSTAKHLILTRILDKPTERIPMELIHIQTQRIISFLLCCAWLYFPETKQNKSSLKVGFVCIIDGKYPNSINSPFNIILFKLIYYYNIIFHYKVKKIVRNICINILGREKKIKRWRELLKMGKLCFGTPIWA